MASVTDGRGPDSPLDPFDPPQGGPPRPDFDDHPTLVRDSLMRALIASDMNDGLAAISALRIGVISLIPNDALAISIIKQAHAFAEQASQRLYGEPLAIAELRYTNATRRILQDAVWISGEATGI
jgi:hypothetical protein